MLTATMVLATTMWTWTGPAPRTEASAFAELSREMVRLLNAADPAVMNHEKLRPVAELVDAAERMHAELGREGLNLNQASVLLGLMHSSWRLAYQRTRDPTYLCREAETLRDRVGPFEYNAVIAGRVRAWVAEVETEHVKVFGRACPEPPPTPPEPQATPTPPPPEAVQPKPEGPVPAGAPASLDRTPKKKRRSPKRTAVGASLLALSGGSAAGFVAAMVTRAQMNGRIVALEEQILAEQRAPTGDELAHELALNDRHRAATAVAVITGTASIATLAGGLISLLLPERRGRAMATPWSGAGTAGLLIQGRF